DIAAKGIRFFSEIDQTKLAADAGIKLDPSTLLVFGNPPLGTQFIAANPNAGLDWPARLLVTQDGSGAVWTVYTDFAWIAARHGIVNRTEQFKMASMVIASITSSVKAQYCRKLKWRRHSPVPFVLVKSHIPNSIPLSRLEQPGISFSIRLVTSS